jgi:hypothetical protein
MTGTVLYIGDKLFRIALRPSKLSVEDRAKKPYQVNILPFIIPSNVICLPCLPLVEDKVDGRSVVLDIKPVAHVFSLPVNRY